MKKALVLALTVLMVLSMATAAFAVEVTYEGEVAVTWGGSKEGEDTDKPGFGKDTLDASVKVDFNEDFGNGVTAGVTTLVQISETDEDLFEMSGLEFDSAGWIQLERDLFTAKASTGIDGGVGKDFGEYAITKAPGLGLDLNLIDGLTVNTIANAGPDYNFLLKGEFAQDLFTVGGGFQSFFADDDDDPLTEDVKRSALGVYGTLNLIDGLAINGEFGSRNSDVDDKDNEAITAILATAAYDLDALSAKAGFLMQDAGFASLSDDDADQDWRINEAARFSGEVQENEYKVTVLFADASYQLTDALAVNGNFDYLLSAKTADDKDLTDAEEDDLVKLSYKVGASYTFDALTLEGWFKGYVKTQFGGKATYALAENVDTSFEVTSTKDDKDDKDAKLAYTAKIVAAL